MIEFWIWKMVTGLFWMLLLCGVSGSIACLLWKLLLYFPYFKKQTRFMRNSLWIVALCWLLPVVFGYWFLKENGTLIHVRMFQATPAIKIVLGIGLVIWFAGTASKLLFWHQQLRKTTVMKQNAMQCTEKTEHIFQEVLKLLGMKAKVQVRLNKEMSPLVTGGAHSWVMIPSCELAETDLRTIFIHELTHVRHRDDWLRNILMIISCLNWYNPLAIQLVWDMDAWNEYYCDSDSMKTAGIGADEYFTVVERSVQKTRECRNQCCQQIYKDGKRLKKRKEQLNQTLEKKVWERWKTASLYLGNFICIMCLSFALGYMLVHAYDDWYLHTEMIDEVEMKNIYCMDIQYLEYAPYNPEEYRTIWLSTRNWENQKELKVSLEPGMQYEYGPIIKNSQERVIIQYLASDQIQIGIRDEKGMIEYIEKQHLLYDIMAGREQGAYYIVFRNGEDEPVDFQYRILKSSQYKDVEMMQENFRITKDEAIEKVLQLNEELSVDVIHVTGITMVYELQEAAEGEEVLIPCWSVHYNYWIDEETRAGTCMKVDAVHGGIINQSFCKSWKQ